MSFDNPLGLQILGKIGDVATEYLDAHVSEWKDRTVALSDGLPIALGSKRTTDGAMGAHLLLLNAALREERSEVLLYVLNYLGSPWDEQLPSVVGLRLSVWANATFAVQAWKRFRDMFTKWLAHSASDISQLSGLATSLTQSAMLVALCTRAQDPLRAQGCELLVELVTCYSKLCSDTRYRAQWSPSWTTDVAQWRANCDVTTIHKAGLRELYIYLGTIQNTLAQSYPPSVQVAPTATPTRASQLALPTAPSQQVALLLQCLAPAKAVLARVSPLFEHLRLYQAPGYAARTGVLTAQPRGVQHQA